MSTETVVLLVVLVIIVGALPAWPYSRAWGYGPSSAGLIVALVLMIWLFANNRNTTSSELGNDLQRAGNNLQREAERFGEDVSDSLRNLAK